jgi:hypothetical protein
VFFVEIQALSVLWGRGQGPLAAAPRRFDGTFQEASFLLGAADAAAQPQRALFHEKQARFVRKLVFLVDLRSGFLDSTHLSISGAIPSRPAKLFIHLSKFFFL